MPLSDPIPFLTELTACPSVNPDLVPGGRGEGEAASYVAGVLRKQGLDVEVREVVPGRPNVVALLDGSGPTLLLNGHLDTVGTEGMNDPFTPRQGDGRLYGRGALDMKGGMAAMMAAAITLAGGAHRKGRLIVAAVCDEEYESRGTAAFVQEVRADGAVVCEPTDLRPGVAHKGFAWAEVEVQGRAAHGSRPEEGVDAIRLMGKILDELDRVEADLEQDPPHPLLGYGSLHASLIKGGQELSSYPARCRLTLERRTLPGEAADTFLDELSAVIERLRPDNPKLRATVRPLFSRGAFEADPNAAITQALLAACEEHVGCQIDPVGLSFWTDAFLLQEAGIPTVLIGPRGEGLHSRDEWVEIASVRECAALLVRTAELFWEMAS